MAPNASDSSLMAAEEQSTRTPSVQESLSEKLSTPLVLDPAVERNAFLTGWRLQVLSIRSAECDHSYAQG